MHNNGTLYEMFTGQLGGGGRGRSKFPYTCNKIQTMLSKLAKQSMKRLSADLCSAQAQTLHNILSYSFKAYKLHCTWLVCSRAITDLLWGKMLSLPHKLGSNSSVSPAKFSALLNYAHYIVLLAIHPQILVKFNT